MISKRSMFNHPKLKQVSTFFTSREGFFRLSFLLSVLAILLLVIDVGFNQAYWAQSTINGFYFVVILIGISTTFLRHFKIRKDLPWKVRIFDASTVLFTLFIVTNHLVVEFREHLTNFFYSDFWVNISVVLTFIREISERNIQYKRKTINPAQLFIMSFLGIIFIGALLLKLPNATYDGISFLDALFTSTSAVCVTGLIVVDTATYFTQIGQTIILILIQIGGLGILTFASYFAYFFKGGSSYENQLTIGEMTNAKKIGEVFSTLKRILLLTFVVELIGAVLIYLSMQNSLMGLTDKIYFSIFHSISSFCNAGFSIFSEGLYDVSIRYNYAFQLAIIFLFVMGGLGFPIMVNILSFLRYFVRNKVLFFLRGVSNYKPWVLNLNSRITLVTTISLTLIGTLLFFIAEYNNTLAEHGLFGKMVNALFGASTPRTAGFNTIDMTQLRFSTIMLIFLLMWIGASPESTGGGIKTSTFALATLNFIALARGKNRIEIYRREISEVSIQRAFAVISLSLVVIGGGIILISIFDSDKDLLSIAFECFSAYSTVGLSIGITAKLSAASKLVLAAIMFIGRVSMLTLLIAVFKKIKHKNYRYPKEEITIN